MSLTMINVPLLPLLVLRLLYQQSLVWQKRYSPCLLLDRFDGQPFVSAIGSNCDLSLYVFLTEESDKNTQSPYWQAA